MKKYNIGLDFGTYQTKSCILDLENDVHEFFLFPSNGEYFLLSRVADTPDGRFEYGPSLGTPIVKEFFYFKIAAAEDPEFRLETFQDDAKSVYNKEDFAPYTPEFLSVVFLTYVLFTIKDELKARQPKKKVGGLLSRVLTQHKDEVTFSVQLGIPTEWSQQKNLRRKRKFENILMIAESLQEKYASREKFLHATIDHLLADVHKIYSSFSFPTIAAFYKRLNELNISIFPETAAGLTFILKTKQLNKGCYAIMDIGGGSTDISFFYIDAAGNIKYFASESYILAANNVYKEYASNEAVAESLVEAERHVQSLIRQNLFNDNENLVRAICEIRSRLNKLTYKLFKKRVWWFKRGMSQEYDHQPLIVYGGGSRIPGFDSGRVLIDDNGARYSITIPQYHMEREHIDRFTQIANILPADNSWKEHFCVLVVALGLSYIKPEKLTEWFGDEDYRKLDGDAAEFDATVAHHNNIAGGAANQVPHPYNEDCFIYDVLSSKWK